MTDYPQIEKFIEEVIRLYGDMSIPENRDRAFPNVGVDDRKFFDAICKLYYERQQPQKGKKK